MDEQEKIVEQYLKSQGYESIMFEPDRNNPPDFLVNDSIAIEVRRLNQHHESNGNSTGLEVKAIPLYQAVNKMLDEYSGQYVGRSYFVRLIFGRPIQKAKTIKRHIRKALSDYANSPKEERIEVIINEGLSLKIFPATSREDRFFIMAGYSDRDSGGWVLSEMERNILICSEEKLSKVQKVRGKYKVWWLALVDHIGHGIGEDERKGINSELLKGHSWDKVLIINPLRPEDAYEI